MNFVNIFCSAVHHRKSLCVSGDMGPEGPYGGKGEKGFYGEFGSQGEKGYRVSPNPEFYFCFCQRNGMRSWCNSNN
jgi:hypothetical protein